MENEISEEVVDVVETLDGVHESNGEQESGVAEGGNGEREGTGWSFARLMAADRRLAHVLIDMEGGDDAEVAIERYFGRKGASEADIAEAEERGYVKGRNEAVEMKMREMKESPMILDGMRRGWWE